MRVQIWQEHILEAELPIMLSCRDGRLLKPVPAQIRMDADELTGCLKAVLTDFLRKESQRLLYQAAIRST